MKKRNEKNIIRIISDPNIRRLGEDTRRPFINRFHFLQRKPNKEGYQKTKYLGFDLLRAQSFLSDICNIQMVLR
ncbi:uncharacterized protein OCT59_011937 [Rhizophagus irregularis]|uniref:uncharacterized protein n=1 Tax=Rhizophagus irregularis TaxID=588596 RepID=UPI0033186167|nr:hypothetical protein OCT59_011937 [Rhizophagus irregularis]